MKGAIKVAVGSRFVVARDRPPSGGCGQRCVLCVLCVRAESV